MDKYLIINADDFGMCRSQNLAIYDLFEKGGITSSTVMTPCAWGKEAAVWAKNHPEYAVGVHLTFTSEYGTYRWSPVARNNTDSLRDEEGFMYHEPAEFELGCKLSEVEAEIRAQIERFKEFGGEPSHIDNHMGTLYGIEAGKFELLELTIKLAAEYNLPFRFPSVFTEEMFSNDMLGIKVNKELIKGLFKKITSAAEALNVAMPDYLIPGDWNGPQKESYENFKEYIYEMYRRFPNGVTETYIHPALDTDELRTITGSWQRRAWEHRLFSDPQTLDHIAACGIKLINYRDLKKMKSK